MLITMQTTKNTLGDKAKMGATSPTPSFCPGSNRYAFSFLDHRLSPPSAGIPSLLPGGEDILNFLASLTDPSMFRDSLHHPLRPL